MNLFLKHPLLWIRKNILRQSVIYPEDVATCQKFLLEIGHKPTGKHAQYSDTIFKPKNTIPDYHSLIFSKESMERASKIVSMGDGDPEKFDELEIPYKKFMQKYHIKNKILVFAFEHYYPSGGMNDLIGVYPTIEEAVTHWKNQIKQKYFDGTIQICDGSVLIKEFDYQTPDSKAINTMQSVYIHRLPGDPDDAKGVMIKMDTSHEGRPWENRQYYIERWAGIFGYNTGTEHIVPIYKIDGDQDITPEMTLRYGNDYFVFYEKDDIYYSEVFIHGEKYVNSCKTKEEVNALAERAVKLFFDTPKKPCSK